MPEKLPTIAALAIPNSDRQGDAQHDADRIKALVELSSYEPRLVTTDGGEEAFEQGTVEREAAEIVLARRHEIADLDTVDNADYSVLYGEIPSDAELGKYIQELIPHVLSSIAPTLREGLVYELVTQIIEGGRPNAVDQYKDLENLPKNLTEESLKKAVSERIGAELNRMHPILNKALGALIGAIIISAFLVAIGGVLTENFLTIVIALSGTVAGMAGAMTGLERFRKNYESLAAADPSRYRIGIPGLPPTLENSDITSVANQLIELSSLIGQFRARFDNATLRGLTANGMLDEQKHIDIAFEIETIRVLSRRIQERLEPLVSLQLDRQPATKALKSK